MKSLCTPNLCTCGDAEELRTGPNNWCRWLTTLSIWERHAGEIYHLWAASGKWTEVGCSRKGQGALLSKKRCLQTELVKEWAKVSRQTKDSSQGDMCNASLHQERRNWTTAEMVVWHFSWGQKMFHLKYGSRDEEGIERMVVWKKMARSMSTK